MYQGARYLGAVPFTRHPVFLSGPFLGATGAEGYAQAKMAVAKWDSLVTRVDKLANATSKAAIVKWIGNVAEEPSGVENDPLSRYWTVLNTVREYEALTDPAKKATFLAEKYNNAEEGQIEKLEAFNTELLAMVVEAEKGGIVTPPITSVTPKAEAFPWVPVGIAAGAVALAIGVIAFSGSSRG